MGMLAGRDSTFARQQWNDALDQVMVGIYQRGGPLPAEVRAGVENVNRSRGKQTKIAFASDVAQAGLKQFET